MYIIYSCLGDKGSVEEVSRSVWWVWFENRAFGKCWVMFPFVATESVLTPLHIHSIMVDKCLYTIYVCVCVCLAVYVLYVVYVLYAPRFTSGKGLACMLVCPPLPLPEISTVKCTHSTLLTAHSLPTYFLTQFLPRCWRVSSAPRLGTRWCASTSRSARPWVSSRSVIFVFIFCFVRGLDWCNYVYMCMPRFVLTNQRFGTQVTVQGILVRVCRNLVRIPNMHTTKLKSCMEILAWIGSQLLTKSPACPLL